MLSYASTQAYKLLLEQFPLPSLSLLKKLYKGGMEPLKAVKILLDQGKIGKDIVLLDEIYLQKDVQYQGGKLVGVGVTTFMINSLKQSIPFVIKAAPEVKLRVCGFLNYLMDVFIHYIRQVLILWQLFQTITP